MLWAPRILQRAVILYSVTYSSEHGISTLTFDPLLLGMQAGGTTLARQLACQGCKDSVQRQGAETGGRGWCKNLLSIWLPCIGLIIAWGFVGSRIERHNRWTLYHVSIRIVRLYYSVFGAVASLNTSTWISLLVSLLLSQAFHKGRKGFG
jgi:hypothetical protein